MENKMYFYGIFNKNDECLYVGKTVNPQDAKTRHKSFHSWSNEIHYYKILFIEDDREMKLINEYQAKYNKERYTGGTSKFNVGDIFGHIDKSKNTHLRKRTTTHDKPYRIRHKPTGVIYKSGYAVAKSGISHRYDIPYTLNRSPTSPLHEEFELVD